MMAPSDQLPIAIVGAGISGLTAAFRLHQAGRKVVVFEASERVGGNINTAQHDGFLYDLGPDSFLRTKPAGAQLCSDLGLDGDVISPREGAHLVHVARDGKLHPMPEGLSLGVPKRPGPLLSTPLLSFGAKLRAMMEPFIPPRKGDAEETIQQFLERRLGAQMAERLAAPLLSGVYAGDASKISIDAAFPQLVAMEKKHGSLFSGMNGGKSILQVLREPVERPKSPFMTLRSGLGALFDALVAALPEDAIRLSTRIDTVAPQEDGTVQLSFGGHTLSCAHLIVACPPWAAKSVVGMVDEKLGQGLGTIEGFSTATVFFGLSEQETDVDLRGSGFIVPPGEADILASTFISSKWAGRAPEGAALVRAFVGGARRDITGLSDDDLEQIARKELSRFLGNLGPIQFSRVYRYQRGSPQPVLGVLDSVKSIQAKVSTLPWLSLIGSGYSGAGIPDCIRQANEAAAELAVANS